MSEFHNSNDRQAAGRQGHTPTNRQQTSAPQGGNRQPRPTAARRPVYGANNPAGNIPRQRPATRQTPGAPRQNGQTATSSARPGTRSGATAVKGRSMRPATLFWIILAVATLLVAMTFLAIYLTGFRSVSYKFMDQATNEEYSITFRGSLDANGDPKTGTIHYPDGSKSKLEPNEAGGYTISYQNGDVYTGQVQKLQRHGKGEMKLANGDSFTGGFAYDRMDGIGTYQFATGDVYYGGFSAGKKSGEGRYTWSDGSTYVGSFQNDLRNGQGTYTYTDGSVYEGKFVDDKKEDTSAKMTIVCSDGESVDSYVGAYVADMRQGKGVYTWANGEVYQGEFSANLIDGEGTYTWTDGRTYTGHFTAGSIDASRPGQWSNLPAGSGSSDVPSDAATQPTAG